MAKVAELWVEIGAKLDKFNRAMNQMDKKMATVGRKMTAIGKKMTLGITLPIIAIGGAAIKTAMDAIESEQLFDVSMKGMADSARKWSEKLRDELGLNSFEVRKSVGIFNVMMASMGLATEDAYGMAKGLTQLSYDMASFYNLRPDEMFVKLQAAISGEVEPLKRLGIIVNETTIKTWALNNGMIKQGEVLSETQKVTARFNVIMERTIDAQGDLARTMESPTNRIRIMKGRITELGIEIGMKLLPAFEKILDRIESGIKWFSGLSESTKDLIIKFAGLAAVAGPLVLVLGKVLAMTAALKISTVGLVGAFSMLIPAAAAVYGALKLLEALRPAEVIDEQTKAYKKLTEVIGFWSDFEDAAVRAGIENREKLIAIWDKYGQNTQATLIAIATGTEGKALQEFLRKLTKGHSDALVAAGKHGKSLEDLPPKIEETGKAIKKALPAFTHWSTTIGRIFHETSIRAAELRESFDFESIIPPAAFEMTKMSLKDLMAYIEQWRIEFNEKMEKLKKKFVDIFSAMAGATSNFFTQIGNLSAVNYQNQINRVDAEYDARKKAIDASTLDDEKKYFATEKLERNMQLKKKAIQRRAFESQKKISLITAAINIAEAITKALTGAIPPWNLILAGITGAAGLIQLATISSQTFPGFKEGGYVERETIARLHPGEFVLSAPDAKALASPLGEGGRLMRIIIQNKITVGEQTFYKESVRSVNRAGEMGDIIVPIKVVV